MPKNVGLGASTTSNASEGQQHHLQHHQQRHSTKPPAAAAAASAAEVGSVDPAYMKQFSATMETRDLGHRLSQDQLRQLSERNLMNRSFELGFLDGPISEGVSAEERAWQEQLLQKRRQQESIRQQRRQHPLTSGSNADMARREAVLQGEFDIISRSHVTRFEQDSAFKKEQRVLTPETVALKQNRRELVSRGVLPAGFQYPPALDFMPAANANAAKAAGGKRAAKRTETHGQ